MPRGSRLTVQKLMPYAAISFIVLLLYSQALSFPFVSSDDHLYLTYNPATLELSLATLRTIFTAYDPELYVPLTLLSYQLEYQVVGLQPFLYHLNNVLLHALNVSLVFTLLWRFSRSKTVGLLSAVAFAVHPLNVEAVAWVSSRKDLLSAAFALMSLLLYERFLDRPSTAAQPSTSLRLTLSLSKGQGQARPLRAACLTGSLILFGLSLLSKVSAVLLPLVLISLDWMQGRRLDRTSLLEKTPFVLFSLLFGIVALYGKSTVHVAVSLGERFLLILKGVLFALAKFLWPHPLSIIYPASDISLLETPILLPLLMLGFLYLLGWLKSSASGRAPAVGLLIAFLFLLPSALIPQHAGVLSLPADKYVYLPMVGLLLSLGVILKAQAQRAAAFLRRGVAASTVLMLFVLALLSFLRLPVWSSSMALYGDALKHFPNDARMYYNLGVELSEVRQLPQAEDSFRRAIALKPDYANAYVNLGIVLVEQHRTEEGAAAMREALRIEPRNAVAHNVLGTFSLGAGEIDTAIAEFESALAINPHFLRARYNLISAYARKGMVREAQEETRQVLELERE